MFARKSPLPSSRTAEVSASDATARNAYYAAASRWDSERLRTMEVSRNRAWLAAGLCLLASAAMAMAVFKLATDHKVAVVTVAFDARTNMVRHVDYSDQRLHLTSNEGFIRNQVYQFMMNLETFDPSDGAHRRQFVSLFSDPALGAELVAQMARAEQPEPSSFKQRRVLTNVTVQSIAMLNPQTAHVQFSAQDVFENRATASRDWAAVVSFKFANLAESPVTIQEAMVNPFKFQVTGYRKTSAAN